jgi:PAS domain-containing protein
LTLKAAMTLPEGLLLLLFAAISLLSAAVAVILTGYMQNVVGRWSRTRGGAGESDDQEASSAPPAISPIRYAFSGGELVSDLGVNDPFLAPDIDRAYAASALSEAMAVLRPDLPDRIADLMVRGEPFRVVGYLGVDALSITGTVDEDTLVVSVTAAVEGEGRLLEATDGRIAALQRSLALCADAQWTEAANGVVTWCNPAYLKLCSQAAETEDASSHWPPPRVFGEQLDPPPTDGAKRRCYLKHGQPVSTRWFEVGSMRLSEGEVLYSARPIDKLVTAENSLRDFVQTLSKTFATLPVGLAVFDRKRELVLFNPALVSTSMLEPGFLSRRPTLRSFLDQLREMRRMPEPRDYQSWRDEITRLEQSAEQDRYYEIWTLPSGETLRVTGRPHPNGAIAFLFEDISQEVSLTRRFRTDLDLDRHILDDFPAGMIVFDREGNVRRTNAAYRALIGAGPENARVSADATLTEMTSAWQNLFRPTGLWGEIRQFVRHETDRAAWSDVVTEMTGTRVQCRVAPLRGGNTIVWFLPDEVSWSDMLSESIWPTITEDTSPTMDDEAAPSHGEGVA